MEIMPNWGLVALQAIPFAITLVALKYIILDPMFDYLQSRENATVGGRQEIEELEAKVVESMAKYETKLDEARAEAADVRAQFRAKATAEHDAIVAKAREQAEQEISKAVAAIVTAQQAARADIDTVSRSLAGQITGKVLGRDVGVN